VITEREQFASRVADDYGRWVTEMQRPDITLVSSMALIAVWLDSMAALLSSGFGNQTVDVRLFDS
jgi:hypothetical protein